MLQCGATRLYELVELRPGNEAHGADATDCLVPDDQSSWNAHDQGLLHRIVRTSFRRSRDRNPDWAFGLDRFGSWWHCLDRTTVVVSISFVFHVLDSFFARAKPRLLLAEEGVLHPLPGPAGCLLSCPGETGPDPPHVELSATARSMAFTTFSPHRSTAPAGKGFSRAIKKTAPSGSSSSQVHDGSYQTISS